MCAQHLITCLLLSFISDSCSAYEVPRYRPHGICDEVSADVVQLRVCTHKDLSFILLCMQVLLALEQDPSVLARCGLTPACLPALVDHNPVIAVEVSHSLSCLLDSCCRLTCTSWTNTQAQTLWRCLCIAAQVAPHCHTAASQSSLMTEAMMRS